MALTLLRLLMSATAALGGLMAAGTMASALLAHFTVLGIEVQGDGGLLFALAGIVLAGGSITAWMRRTQLPRIGARFRARASAAAAR